MTFFSAPVQVRVRVSDPALERWEVPAAFYPPPPPAKDLQERALLPYQVPHFTEMCGGSEEGSYLRLIDLCITQP